MNSYFTRGKECSWHTARGILWFKGRLGVLGLEKQIESALIKTFRQMMMYIIFLRQTKWMASVERKNNILEIWFLCLLEKEHSVKLLQLSLADRDIRQLNVRSLVRLLIKKKRQKFSSILAKNLFLLFPWRVSFFGSKLKFEFMKVVFHF